MSTTMLGCTYKDRVTGFSGVCTGICFYLTGCNQVLLTPKAKEGGDYVESRWLDIQRLEYVDEPKITLDNSVSPGFGETPSRRY